MTSPTPGTRFGFPRFSPRNLEVSLKTLSCCMAVVHSEGAFVELFKLTFPFPKRGGGLRNNLSQLLAGAWKGAMNGARSI